jgi:hypothetical protein
LRIHHTPHRWYCAFFLSAHNIRHGRQEARGRARIGRDGLEVF